MKTGKFSERHYTTTKVTRGINEKRGVCFHHTGGGFQSAINTILNSNRQAGYHCIIDTNGDRAIFNSLDAILWHAGQSEFRGRQHCNRFLIGVSFTGDTTRRALMDDEIASCIEWLTPLWRKFRWAIESMTTHREIARPRGRKIDISATAEQQLFTALRTHFSV